MGDKWRYGNRQFFPSENHPEWYNQEDPNKGYIKEEYRTDGKIDLNKLPITQAGWLEPELEVEEYYTGNPGDFTEFFFDGISSKKLGITRVSSGERYDLDLQPTLNNKKIDVPGGHGYYFFGSQYKDKTFNINIAFDSLTEVQIRKLANVFSPCNELKDFYFQNHPYKVWRVKITNPITLNTVCFDETPKHRRYKGEGTIQLQAFTPFARDRLKYLDDYVQEHRDNKKLVYSEAETYVNEWADASRLIWNHEDISPEEAAAGITRKQWYAYDYYGKVINSDSDFSPALCHVCNAGDFDADYMLYFYRLDGDDTNQKYSYRIRCRSLRDTDDSREFKIKDLIIVPNDAGFRINSKLSLIEGVDENGEPTGTIYNQYKSGGEIFKIPQGEQWILIDDYYGDWFKSKTLNDKITLVGYRTTTWGDLKIEKWNEIKLKTWGEILSAYGWGEYQDTLSEVTLIKVRNENLLSGLKEEDFNLEYQDKYL